MATRLLLCLITAFSLAGAAITVPSAPRSTPDSPYGICATGWSHSGANTDRFDFDSPLRRLKLLAEMGAKWDRCDFWWGRIEPEQGKFVFRDFDRAVEQYLQYGIELMPILCYGSAWHGRSPDTPEEWKLYARWAGEMVRHYRGKISAWEVWNEPNISVFWKPQPNAEHYVNMLKAAYRVMKKADPKCIVVAPATAGIDLGYIQRFLELGGGHYCDVISVHPYQGANHGPEPGLLNSLRKLKDLLASYHLRQPIWITEMGWQTKPAEQAQATEDQQADYLVRSYVLALSEGVQRLFWFNLVDWAETWGTVRTDWTTKPSYRAYQVMVKTLGEHPRCFGKLELGEGVYGFVFSKPRAPQLWLVLWSTVDGKTYSITSAEVSSMSDSLGTPIQGERDGSELVFRLSPRPLYLLLAPGSTFKPAHASWPLLRSPLPLPCRPDLEP